MKLSSKYFLTGHILTLSDFHSACENKCHVMKTSSAWLKVVIDKPIFARYSFKRLYTVSQAYSLIIHSLFISHITCLCSLQIVKRGMSQRSNLPPPLISFACLLPPLIIASNKPASLSSIIKENLRPPLNFL